MEEMQLILSLLTNMKGGPSNGQTRSPIFWDSTGFTEALDLFRLLMSAVSTADFNQI